ncbi:hypothetical protein AB0L26_07930 [Streptomyces nondiastaticus]|uniref:hypothetical protein n=1 Tax=Streptomyces nondiastaticus TaxID=3154512 RepID=UPI0034147FBC
MATPLMVTLLRRLGTRLVLLIAIGPAVFSATAANGTQSLEAARQAWKLGWRRRINRLGQQHAEVPGPEEAGLHPLGRP